MNKQLVFEFEYLDPYYYHPLMFSMEEDSDKEESMEIKSSTRLSRMTIFSSSNELEKKQSAVIDETRSPSLVIHSFLKESDLSRELEKEYLCQSSPTAVDQIKSPAVVINYSQKDSVFTNEDLDIFNMVWLKISAKTESNPSKNFDGLFPPQNFSPRSQVSSLTQLLINAKPFDWQVYYFLQVHRTKFAQALYSINAPFIHQLLLSEVMDELYCYHVHHQIKIFRENFDKVLDELLEEECAFEDFDPGFPGFSRASTPML